MVKVLAAELSDQGRLSRGKRYWAEDAVVDLVVGHGAVTAVIQGSRPEPYVVTIDANAGKGVPSKREVWISCTCPDDGTATEACKHAVAALFALSDEVAIEPDLIDRWRAGSRRRPSDAAREAGLAEVIPLHPESRREPEVREARPAPRDPTIDEISGLLGAPNASRPPELPDVSAVTHTGIRDRQLAEVLEDAILHLAIRWE